ncbi:MAG: patatin-like phospholipase family protein, partial [Fimbriiglobus sp.]|nr:patatin-like phospholipase family protein [Fimbriiglobus sp.]
IARPIADILAAQYKANTPPATPRHALLLSGGGQYASYNAGCLVGWTQSGSRPKFDVVTGISGGAIVAVYAFIGERYDAPLQQFFTTVGNRDLFAIRPFIGLLRDGSMASPKRLEALIEREANDCLLADLRAAHQEGRRLYLGTMNVRTRRLVVWDVGAIACSGRPDAAQLVRKVILASVSIPGQLPAVRFEIVADGKTYTEEHVDGGAASQTFLRLPAEAQRPTPTATGWLEGSNLYVMAAGKLYAPNLEGKLSFLKRVTSTVSAALYALYRSEVLNLYAFCGVSGMKFQMIAIPPETEVPGNSMTFEPKEMQKLFALGYEQAKGGVPWRLTPPGAEPGEEEHPRDVPLFVPERAK